MSTLISTLVLALAFRKKQTYDRIKDDQQTMEFEGLSLDDTSAANIPSGGHYVIGVGEHGEDDGIKNVSYEEDK